jgi:hypothetical protein
MKRWWGHILAGSLLLAAAAAISTACVKDDSTVFIFDVLQQQLVSAGSSCLFTSDPTQPYISAGRLDIGFRETYQATFLVGNQIVPQGNPTIPQTETSYVQFNGAVVSITDTEGNQLANYTEMVGAAALAPAQGTTPSFEPIGVTIVDQGTVDQIAPAVIAGATRTLITHTYFFGQTLGGENVQTGEFAFPVTVCYGCLVSFSPGDVDQDASVIPNCENAVGSSSTTALPGPCYPGEDFSVDCSQCLALSICRPGGSGLDAGTD